MLEKIVEIVRQAGKIMLERGDFASYKKEGVGDFATDYDLRVQAYLHSHLAEFFPNARFASEEDDSYIQSDEASEWFIIDPIDGTSNFICDQRMSAICVAHLSDGEIRMAVVYNPYADELFSAEKGVGAWLNGKAIRVEERDFALGMVEFGASPYDESLRKPAFRLAEALSYHALDVHRLGAAALAICYVANNRNILYFDFSLSPWDYAAASLILQEAGGVCESMDGQPLRFDKAQSILACAGNVVGCFRQVWQDLEL